MNIERIDSGQITILRIAGDIDEAGLDTLRISRYELDTEGRFYVVLNLHGVRFVTYTVSMIVRAIAWLGA